MKTVGDTLKSARFKKRYSLNKVEKETKIKKSLLKQLKMETGRLFLIFPLSPAL